MTRHTLGLLLASTLSIPTLFGCSAIPETVEAIPPAQQEDAAVEQSTDKAVETKADEAPTTKNANENELQAIIGPDDGEWMPRAITELGIKKDMSPAEVAAIVPGADDLDDYGSSNRAEVEGIPGLPYLKFFYYGATPEEREVKSVTLIIDPAVAEQYTFDEMVAIFSEKYGEVNPDLTTDASVIWSNQELFTQAQFSSFGMGDIDDTTFQITFPE